VAVLTWQNKYKYSQPKIRCERYFLTLSLMTGKQSRHAESEANGSSNKLKYQVRSIKYQNMDASPPGRGGVAEGKRNTEYKVPVTVLY
jgi:hypothetical protein